MDVSLNTCCCREWKRDSSFVQSVVQSRYYATLFHTTSTRFKIVHTYIYIYIYIKILKYLSDHLEGKYNDLVLSRSLKNLDELPAFGGRRYAENSGEPAYLPGMSYRKA